MTVDTEKPVALLKSKIYTCMHIITSVQEFNTVISMSMAKLSAWSCGVPSLTKASQSSANGMGLHNVCKVVGVPAK